MKYRVKNWAHFQHYKDRNPPWIKLHFTLLTSQDWVTLADQDRVLAIVCMLVASRNGGEIDGSDAGLAYLQRVGYLNRKPNLKSLLECGFLEPASGIQADSSGCKRMLAEFRPETEDLKENLTDKTTAPPVEKLPLKSGSEFHVTADLVAELDRAYPAVDVPTTLKEIRAWLVTHPDKLSEGRKGTLARINSWMKGEQEKHGRQA